MLSVFIDWMIWLGHATPSKVAFEWENNKYFRFDFSFFEIGQEKQFTGSNFDNESWYRCLSWGGNKESDKTLEVIIVKARKMTATREHKKNRDTRERRQPFFPCKYLSAATEQKLEIISLPWDEIEKKIFFFFFDQMLHRNEVCSSFCLFPWILFPPSWRLLDSSPRLSPWRLGESWPFLPPANSVSLDLDKRKERQCSMRWLLSHSTSLLNVFKLQSFDERMT